eukprot:6262911-Alexandrium_andersonii.AAC.1
MPEANVEDIDEEMGLLMNIVQEGEDWAQEGSESLRLRAASDPCDAPDFIRALFAAGATPGEVRASVMEVFSPPRVAAMAERRPRYGAVSYTHLRAHETSAHL